MLLMKKDIAVADINMLNGNIYKINQVYHKESLPVGLYSDKSTQGIEADEMPLNAWWKNNSNALRQKTRNLYHLPRLLMWWKDEYIRQNLKWSI